MSTIDHVVEPAAGLTPAAGRPPRAPAGAAYVGALTSLALIAAGGVGIRDGVVAAGWLTGSSWTAAAVDWVDGLSFSGWMTYAGIAAVVVGLGLVVLAVKPRRKTSLEVAGRSSIVITHADLARAAASAARAVPGVLDARATSTRRHLRIKARSTTGKDGSAAVQAAVTSAVDDTLGMLATRPRITVRIRPSGGPG